MRPCSKSLRYLEQLLGFDVGVSQEMGLQVGFLIETSLTDRTAMRRLLVMEDFVNGQGSVLTETLSTVITFEWFLFAVDVTMIPGIYSVRKFIFRTCVGWGECNGLP